MRLSPGCRTSSTTVAGRLRRARGKTDKDYSTRASHVRIHQLTEVFILRDQEAIVFKRPFSNIIVFFARRNFSDRYDIMALSTKRTHHGETATLISQKAHRLTFRALFGRFDDNRFLVRQSVGRIANGGLYILRLEARIRIEQIVRCGTLTEFSKDQFDRYTASSNDRFPHHNFWIDLDTVCNRHTAISFS